MSHVFISYAHADKAHLDKLVAWLHDNDFGGQEIWYDQHIESGNNWRDEIAEALDEAYAVLVIVTANSVKSLYCTFEWGYAIGQGIPLLPLAFDNLSIANVFPPLTSRQFTNCTENIPASLKEQIRQLKSVPPQVAAINKTIYEAIYDTHRCFFILGWIGNNLGDLEDEFIEAVIVYFSKKALEAYQVLQSLMVDKAFVFSGKQYRYCWILIDFLKGFSRLDYKAGSLFGNPPVLGFDNSWLLAFEYFEGNGWWRKRTRKYFERDLEDEHNRMQVFAEVMRAFPIFQVSDVEILIHNINNRQKLKEK